MMCAQGLGFQCVPCTHCYLRLTGSETLAQLTIQGGEHQPDGLS